MNPQAPGSTKELRNALPTGNASGQVLVSVPASSWNSNKTLFESLGIRQMEQQANQQAQLTNTLLAPLLMGAAAPLQQLQALSNLATLNNVLNAASLANTLAARAPPATAALPVAAAGAPVARARAPVVAPAPVAPSAPTPSPPPTAAPSSTASANGQAKSHVEQWNQRYQDMLKFRKEFGHCLVPLKWPVNPSLAHWVKRQRYQYKLKKDGSHSTLTDEREAALESLGFVWDSHAATWEERWNELKEFKAKTGHCNVPKKYPPNPQLSIWVKCQRRQYKLGCEGKSTNMTQARILKLKALGFVFDPRKKNAGR